MSEVILEQVVLADEALGRTMRRLAQEIVEANGGTEKLAIVGIHTGGVHLARRLVEQIQAAEGKKPSEGAIDITLYRDDVFIGLPQPVVGRTEMPFDVTGTRIVLVDDVLFSGRTVRSATPRGLGLCHPGPRTPRTAPADPAPTRRAAPPRKARPSPAKATRPT